MNLVKKTSIFALSILALMFLVSFASATISMSAITAPASVAHDSGTFSISFNLTNNDVVNQATVSFTTSSLSPSGSSVSGLSTTVVPANSTIVVSGTVSIPLYSTNQLSGTITAANGSSTDSKSYVVPITTSRTLSLSAITTLTSARDGVINVTNTGNAASTVNLSSTGSLNISFSKNNFNLNSGASDTVTVVANSINSSKFGSNSASIKANVAGTSNNSNTITFTIDKTFCSLGSTNTNLSIRNIDFSNSDGDEDQWTPLDKVTIDVEVYNNAQDNVKSVYVVLGLFDEDGNDVVSDLLFSDKDDEKKKLSTIEDRDSKTATFEFVVPADLDGGNYKLAVKAYSDSVGEDYECDDRSTDLGGNDFYRPIDIDKETDSGKQISFDKIDISPEQATCGEAVSLSFDTVNIGNEDQDRVFLTVINQELGLSQRLEIIDLNEGKRKSVNFAFVVPKNLANKVYDISVNAQYGYSDGSYDDVLDEPFLMPLRLIGCAVTPVQNAAITATLDSEAKEGSELKISSTITNLGPTSQTFVIDVNGYDTWAELNSVSDRILTLNAGESKTITISLTPSDSSSGTQKFRIDAKVGDKLDSKEVQVSIGSSGLFNLSGSSLIWVIAIVNIILIVLIIVVAVRVSRR